eukprot:CAMPEP_0116862450 /NCGR_PEP_ID=MMETSP0418-20121206/23642_1 /TAXON_ID=1158023 /ORGANISM="Astrosyne radiata, Strain 13vi08-1A" /LENGTH=123 /DNA_ID=CAMNT_0004497299 /DNA_START=1 /DNA_END=373 /DNA_ORIENTATION=+
MNGGEDDSVNVHSLLWGGSEDDDNPVDELNLQHKVIFTTEEANEGMQKEEDDYKTDDESLLPIAGLQSDFDDDNTTPSKRKFREIWNDADVEKPSPFKRVADDKRDWKEKYQIPDAEQQPPKH